MLTDIKILNKINEMIMKGHADTLCIPHSFRKENMTLTLWIINPPLVFSFSGIQHAGRCNLVEDEASVTHEALAELVK